MNEKDLIGKIFISYSSKDREFVNRLDARLKEKGYQTWLDEHELQGGDELTKELSKGINEAKVVIVVVSKNSANSRWLRYEVGIALQNMMAGKSRLVPLLLRDAAPLPEVQGLVYISFQHRFDRGFQRLLDTLETEAEKLAAKAGFWAEIELLLDEEFGPTGSSS